MRRVCLAALLLGAAACESQSRRLLLVDFALTDPLVLDATAAPWHAAGYRVEYRRFYPHLTRHDLTRYRTIVVLGGREPEGSSATLTIGDLAILMEWTRREGGVVVLGYGGDVGEGVGEGGSLDRWIMNRWLAALGTGLAIGTQPLEDTVRVAGQSQPAPAVVPLPGSALDNAGFAPFATGRNHVVLVREPSQALARTTATAFVRAPGGAPASRRRAAVVAASRLQHGLVVVASRHTLAAADLDSRTGDFLEALARWTRRPAEWAGVAPAEGRAPLLLGGAPRPVPVHPPPLTPPPGADVRVLPRPIPPITEESRAPLPAPPPPPVPGWIGRQGMRVLWTGYPPPAIDSVLAFVDAAALNALASRVPVSALADSLVGNSRNVWRLTAERLQTTSLRWFPAVALAELTSLGADEMDRHGDLVPVPCGLDSLFWRGALRPAYRTLARLGGVRPDLIAGVALDLETVAPRYGGGGTGFCDATYSAGLAELGLDRTEIEQLAALPPVARYDTLLERGLLGRYYDAVEGAVAERAAALRSELRRLHPDLRFAFRAAEPPTDWFSLGLLRGLSTRDEAVLLWTRVRPAPEWLARYHERGIVPLWAVVLDPRHVAVSDWGGARLRSLVFVQYDGFWLHAVGSDSVGRLIRRMAK